MTKKEIDLFSSFLIFSDSYLEFGCGGSTFMASNFVRSSVVTVDSSQEWLKKVASACADAQYRVAPLLHFVDIGQTVEWGRPKDESARDRWPDYYRSVWNLDQARISDLCLIDGRFRVACFMNTLLNCRRDALIMVHDFNSRAYYHDIKRVARQICGVDDLAVFLPYQDNDSSLISSLLDQYAFDPN
jgi:hypothetical protein